MGGSERGDLGGFRIAKIEASKNSWAESSVP